MAVAPPTYTNFLVYSSAESAYWNTVVLANGTTSVSANPAALQGSVVSVTFSRVEAAGVREDVALFTMHLAVATGSNNAWAILNASDAGSVETALDTLWNSIKPLYAPHWVLSGYVWRNFGADFPKGKTGLSKPGPVWRQTVRSVAGTSASNGLTDQTACTATLKSASRRHWGRFYLPAPAQTQLGQYSRFSSSMTESVAGAIDSFYGTVNALSRNVHEFTWNSKNPGMFSVSQLVVDDVPDVIRRRRPKVKTYAATRP